MFLLTIRSLDMISGKKEVTEMEFLTEQEAREVLDAQLGYQETTESIRYQLLSPCDALIEKGFIQAPDFAA